MNILQAVQNSFVSMGFNPNSEPLNHILLRTLSISAVGLTSLWIFLLHEAHSPQEYMESIYFVTAGSGIFLSALSIVLLTMELFSFIDRLDELANQSN